MSSRILIDAAHREETRVVVTQDDRVEEFDFESAARKQLRGNIYLAKVTRVEPSLQVAFVDYGGNRHGFLAFSEIHPDYYQIPFADRQALLKEANEEAIQADEDLESVEMEDPVLQRTDETHPDGVEAGLCAENPEEQILDAGEVEESSLVPNDVPHVTHGIPAVISGEIVSAPNEEGSIEETGGSADSFEELPTRRIPPRRNRYKIQEVIKRRQILLVQIVKEERGNKGAAVTTYLSIAGRYCVLMPNTARGGGISRKITSVPERKKLKSIADELQTQLPEGMGVILRTAGTSRTKTEIKRDFEYLIRLWETVRALTLQSTAPVLVYEEGNLIKRSIRDLYSSSISEILVAGAEAYREAKSFMRTLMPSHAKFVHPYEEKLPIFSQYNVESQLDSMFSPKVLLQSGGHIVIDQTEALVSIDVNSGRATREHDIEDTALATNLEAASEIARQLRLRDLAGLIVIDFIDMEEKRNQRAVERKIKDCLRRDRARIQIARISHFGLLEMSRQRMRVGMLEGSSIPCTRCQGTGIIRSVESLSLQLLRTVEESFLNIETPMDLSVTSSTDVALYVLNHKRAHLRDLEEKFGVTIVIRADESIQGGSPILTYGEIAPLTPDSHTQSADSSREGKKGRWGSPNSAANEAFGEGRSGGRRRRKRRTQGEGDGEQKDTQTPPVELVEHSALTEESAEDVGTPSEVAESSNSKDSGRPPVSRRRRGNGRRGNRTSDSRSAQQNQDSQEPPESRRNEPPKGQETHARPSTSADLEEEKRISSSTADPKTSEEEKAKKLALRASVANVLARLAEDGEKKTPRQGSTAEDSASQDPALKQGWWKRRLGGG